MCSDNYLNRRHFLKMTSIVAATAAAGAMPVGNVAYGAALTKAQRDKLTPDEIIRAMKEGNQRFRLGKQVAPRLPRPAEGERHGPVPRGDDTELHRLARTRRDDHGLRHRRHLQRAWRQCRERRHRREHGICVQSCRCEGHPCDGTHGLRRHQGRDRQRTAGNLTGLLAKIRPAVSATEYQGERSAKNYGFVDAVARKNVELVTGDIRRRSSVLADIEKLGCNQARRGDVQPGDGAGRVLRLTQPTKPA